ncbi:MAG: ABC transporter ATP-binding protein [Rhodospirillales bacterium]|nr:ABC transporter ATP-binding protein [Rhodospirillales bacterium]
MTALLEVRNLTLDYATGRGSFRALEDVSLSVEAGEVLGLVGESGSGKTSLAMAVMGHLAGNARLTAGSIRLGGAELTALGPAAMRATLGRRIGMVFQNPSTSLNPTLTLGRQITEVLERHRGLSGREAWKEAVAWLERVELRHAEALMRRYPHEVSGGEKQRVVIATAFAPHPEIVLFDEPTTALDVITGARILELFHKLRAETGVAGLYISHDLGLVARVAENVAVMRGGRIVETGRATHLFAHPTHDYTRRLVDAVPRPHRRLVDDNPGSAELLRAEAIGVSYARRRLFRASPAGGGIDGVSFAIGEGEILGLVGESGSGKSTVARALTGLVRATGSLRLDGVPVTRMRHDYRRAVQIVFQHPDSSLNPRHRVRDILARPLRLYGGSLAQIPTLLRNVNLPADYASRWPHQLSGGEKQRVAIARAFAARPRLVICDEITASLDVSVQASTIELLLQLRRQHGTAYLFITHDLNLIRQIAHRLIVMREGRLVDRLDVKALGSGREHPYTRALMAASPLPVGEETGP